MFMPPWYTSTFWGAFVASRRYRASIYGWKMLWRSQLYLPSSRIKFLMVLSENKS